MNVERYNHVEQIAQVFFDLPADERAAYLDSACGGDQELRREVVSVIEYQEKAASFLEAPAIEDAAGMLSLAEHQTLIGREIGRYKIIRKIGQGGMGEVYLARDSELERPVALKVLPADFATDKQRMHRFIREPKTASALNHPNILTIYEIGHTHGTHFIATEFIEGATLRQHMTAGRMSVRDVIGVAVQTADALAAAHEAGIIHRDIKPENIMLRNRDSCVKVLDFGLAKLTEQGLVTGATEASTKFKTSEGAVMGTASYMSPEQARGLEVDARTDIFSVGVLLYEMLAERRPFEGATTSDIIVAILEKEPPPLARYVPDIPGELQRILNKALRKNREERYQTIKDLLIDLKSLKEELELSARANYLIPPSDSQARGETPVDTSPARFRSLLNRAGRRKQIVILGLVVVLLAGFAGWLYTKGNLTRRGPASQAASFQAMRITKLTISGKAGNPTVSPDGKYIAYTMNENGQTSLWLRQVSTGTDLQLQPPSLRAFPGLVFSPDGNYLYYGRANEVPDQLSSLVMLYRIPAIGGTPKQMLDGVTSPIGFSPDGKQFAFIRRVPKAREDTLIIANSDGSDDRKVVKQPFVDAVNQWIGFHHWIAPAWSPDGNTIICSGLTRILAVNVDTGNISTVPSPEWYRMNSMAWLSDGSGLIVNSREREGDPNQLWHVAYPGGAAQRITNDQNSYGIISLTADSGTLVINQTSERSYTSVSPANDFRQATTINSHNLDGSSGIFWTPDDKLIYTSASNGIPILAMMDADGRNQKQLTELPVWNSNGSPVCLTGDGKYVVFQSDPEVKIQAKSGLWRVDLDGGNPKQLTQFGNWPVSSPDGKWIVFQTRTRYDTRDSVWRVPIDGGEAILISDPAGAPGVSSDGRWITYIQFSGEPPVNSQLKVAIIPFEGGEPIKLITCPSRTNRNSYRWMPDGLALSFTNSIDGVSNIWRQPLDGSPPTKITDFKSDGVSRYDWSRDGKRIVFVRNQTRSDVVAITNFR